MCKFSWESALSLFSHLLRCTYIFNSSPVFVCVCLRFTEIDTDQGNMSERFDCDNCKESLYGRKYIQAEDNPYCIPCYDSLFANTCDECKELIGHDARVSFQQQIENYCFAPPKEDPIINRDSAPSDCSFELEWVTAIYYNIILSINSKQ